MTHAAPAYHNRPSLRSRRTFDNQPTEEINFDNVITINPRGFAAVFSQSNGDLVLLATGKHTACDAIFSGVTLLDAFRENEDTEGTPDVRWVKHSNLTKPRFAKVVRLVRRFPDRATL